MKLSPAKRRVNFSKGDTQHFTHETGNEAGKLEKAQNFVGTGKTGKKNMEKKSMKKP